jgi:protocatechuate 3,4-dioxygenase beta subunit
MITLDSYIETLYQKTKYDLKQYIEMLYVQANSKQPKDTEKQIDEKTLEEYLKKRGYTMNYVLGKRVMVKDFTCVFIQKTYVEIWHDKIHNNKSVYVTESLLTGLPITLTYMERI